MDTGTRAALAWVLLCTWGMAQSTRAAIEVHASLPAWDRVLGVQLVDEGAYAEAAIEFERSAGPDTSRPLVWITAGARLTLDATF